jgi:MFS family permease
LSASGKARPLPGDAFAMSSATQTPTRPARRLAGGVWALGFVSLFMDVSSEMIHGLLPVFLVGSLGVSAAGLGLIEGVAESTAAITKLFSGMWSDRIGRRKPLALLGYGLAALTKPLFPLADSALTVFSARFIDRIGKGIRGAPRDALVADLSPPEQRGAAFGLRQTLDTVGAFLGPLLAIGLMMALGDRVRLVFWIATIPAVIAVLILIFAVREPARTAVAGTVKNPLAQFHWHAFPRSFWRLVVIAVLFTLTRFSEAFLVLRAVGAGLPDHFAPLALVVMNLVYLASAYPAGVLSDRWPRSRLLVAGCVVMILADGFLAFGHGLVAIFVGIALWGFHLGLTEGLLAAMTADAAPAAWRGTAFGVINLVRGVMLLVASVLAGVLWTKFGAGVTFLAGAGFAALTAIVAARRA